MNAQTIATLLAQALSLGAEIYRLEERLRKDPPTDPETLQKYIEELSDMRDRSAALYKEIRALTSSGNVTKEELAAAFARDEASHAGNLRTWADPKPKPPDVPPVKPPDTPPVTQPPAVKFEVFTWYAAPIPDDSILKAQFTRGLKWTSANGDQWAVTPLGGAVMESDPQGNPAVEVGPIK